MTGKTNQLCNEIRRKLISPTSKQPEFKTNAEVIEVAVRAFYDQLKSERKV